MELRVEAALLGLGHHAAVALEQRELGVARRGAVALHDVDDLVLRGRQQDVLRLEVGVDDVD